VTLPDKYDGRSEGSGRPRRRRAASKWGGALILVLALVMAAAGRTTSATAASNTIALVGSVTTCSGNPDANESIIDPGMGALLTVVVTGPGETCPGVSGPGVWLIATSMSKLTPIASAKVGLQDWPTFGFFNQFAGLQVDQSGHRLFVQYMGTDASSNGVIRVATFALDELLAGKSPLTPLRTLSVPAYVDAASGAFSRDDPTEFVDAGVVSATVSQLLYGQDLVFDPASNSLDVLLADEYLGGAPKTSVHGPSSEPFYIFQFNADADGAAAPQWEQDVGKCGGPLTYGGWQGNTFMHVSVGGQEMVTGGCGYTRGLYTGPNFGGGGAALPNGGSMMTWVIALGSDHNPSNSCTTLPATAQLVCGGSIAYYLGRPAVLAAVADPSSGQVYYPDIPPPGAAAESASAPTAVVFDVASKTYIGAPSVGVAQDASGGYAMAVGGGRWYSAGRGGIVVGSSGSTPPGQGQLIAGYSCWTAQVLVDPSSRTLFIRPLGDGSPASCSQSQRPSNWAPDFQVYQDSLTLSAPSSPPDPDGYTSQIPEQPGVTTSQYSGAANAVAARVRLVGGTTGFVNGASFGLQGSVLGASSPGPNDYSTRELDLGVVGGSSLDNFQAAAQATVSMVDHTTNQTYEKQSAKQWPFAEATCNNAGGAAVQQTKPAGYDSSSQASCDYANGTTQAQSMAGALGMTATLAGASSGASASSLPVAVGQGKSDTHVYLDPTAGMVSYSHSIVKNVDLGVVSVAAVEASTTCAAHGHTNTAGCTYLRTISGVDLNPGSVPSSACQPQNLPISVTVQVCGQVLQGGYCQQGQLPATAADPNGMVVDTCGQLLGALNSIDPGILTFTMPIPDQQKNYYGGSPGGYQAVSQREAYTHLQDQTLNYDNSLSVPGLEMLYVNDSPTTPSRLDVQLASTEGEAHYGILQAPAGTTLPGGGGSAAGGGGTGAAAAILGVPATAGTSATTSTTPGTGALAVAAPPVAMGGALGALGEMLQHVWSGLQWLVRSPITGLFTMLLFALLSTPLVTAWRRSRLLAALHQAVP
jgi:hypothetical protein